MSNSDQPSVVQMAEAYVAFLKLNKANLLKRLSRGQRAETIFVRKDDEKLFRLMIHPASLGQLLRQTFWQKAALQVFHSEYVFMEGIEKQVSEACETNPRELPLATIHQ